MKNITLIHAATALTLLLPGVVWGQSSGSSFLNIPTSPRAYALGLSNGVSALGAEAIGSNAANMGLVSRRFEVFSSYATLIDGAQFAHLAAAYAPSSHPLGLDALGLSVTRLQLASLPSADALGNQTGGTFGAGSSAMGLSAAGSLLPELRLGGTVKLVKESIAGYSSNAALAADLGMTYTLAASRPLSFGLGVNNLGQKVRFLSQADPLPLAVNAGVAAPLGPVTAMLELNRLVYDRKTELGTGLEYGLGPAALRAGFLVQSQANNLALRDQGAARMLNGLTAGVGLHLGSTQLDYAVSQQAVELGTTHRVALSLRWGSASTHSPASDDWKSHPDRSDWLLRSMGQY